MLRHINLIFTLLFAVILGGCGIGNNLYLMGHDVTSNFKPHQNKVVRSGKNSFPENGMGVVSLNFISENGNPVETAWKRVDDNNISKRVFLTHFNLHNHGRTESMLDPGTYFLDGIRFSQSNNVYISIGAFNSIYSENQKGWDSNKNQPYWFSFNIKKGGEVIIPDMIVSAYCKSDSSCHDENVMLIMKSSKDSSKISDNYMFGSRVNK